MSAYIPVELRKSVRRQFHNCCAAESLTVAIFEFEHIVPLSAGGKTEFDNLCLSCPTCNRYKASRQFSLEPLSGKTVPLFHPHEQQWREHFTWNESSTEIVGLTSSGNTTIAALRMNRPQLTRVRRMWVAMEDHPPKFE